MEEWCANNTIPNVTFVPVKPSFEVKDCDYSMKGIVGFYKEYRKWHIDVLQVVKSIISSQHIDLIHFLGPIGYHEPGYLYSLPVPYIWGPVGGFGGANPRLIKATCSLKGAVHMLLKRFINEIEAVTAMRVKKALRDSDVVICATTEYQKRISKMIGEKHHSRLFYRAENCITHFYELNENKFSNPLKIAWIGRIDENKGLIFLLEALYKLKNKQGVSLDVVGEDRLNGKMKAWAEKHNISNMITWHGLIPREKVFELLNTSHIVAITSLHEANTTIVWEAMSVGTPILTLDYKGMHDTVSEEAGIKIKPKSYNQIVHDIANALNKLSNNPNILREKSYAVLRERESYSWDNRVDFFEKMYDIAEKQFLLRK